MTHDNNSPLPRQPVDRWIDPISRFLQIEAASGFLLLAATMLALVAANSPWADRFAAIWETHLHIGIAGFELNKPLELWVNDGLMTLFFFVVGLEIKRELVTGELNDLRHAALPVVAALGGMIVPALVFWGLLHGRPGERGWGVPMATDIAFVVGVLAILGQRVPRGLKILLLSLAIVDDIGAILVIAAFYSTNVSMPMLVLGLAGFAVTWGLTRAGVRAVSVYVIVGVVIWLAFLKSGIHPTVAGVMLGLLTPATPLLAVSKLREFTGEAERRFAASQSGSQPADFRELAGQLAQVGRESVSPLERLERGLHGWVGFVIMPLFAVANAGIHVEWTALGDPLALSVATGLILGKPVGIVVFSWLAISAGIARRPEGLSWPVLIGGGCLAGIGFTMSLFIAGLAFQGPPLAAAKFGTLLGSLVSATVGVVVLLICLPRVGQKSMLDLRQRLDGHP